MSTKKKKKRRHPTVNLKEDGVDFGLTNRMMNQARESIGSYPEDKLFRIKLGDYEFDGLPFLTMGADWWDHSNRSFLGFQVLKRVGYSGSIDLVDDLYPSKDMQLIHNAMVPSIYANGTYLVASCLANMDKKEFARIAMCEARNCMQDLLINGKANYLKYKYDEIHNGQAFSYYCLVAWVITLVPSLGLYLGRQLRKCDYLGTMESFMPEGSYLRRLITGQITAREFKTGYLDKSYDDGSSLWMREAYAMMTDSKYDGRDLNEFERDTMETLYTMLQDSQSAKFSMQLGMYYSRSKNRWELTQEVSRLQTRVDVLSSKEEDQRKKYQQIIAKKDDKISRLLEENATVKRLMDENRLLKAKLDFCDDTTSIINENAELQDELASLLNKYKEVKSELRSLRKQCRSTGTDEQQVEDVVVEEAPEPQITRDEMLFKLANRKVIVVGGEKFGFVDYLNEQGIKATQFSKSLRTGCKCDAVLIITKFVGHKDVYAAMSWIAGNDFELIYFNNINREMCIDALYEGIFGN